jgi:gluconolactonase
LADGLKVNEEGFVFATGPGGVLVFSPNGKHLGTIKTGQPTANCALNADESILFMTANNYLMRIKLKPDEK